MTIFKRILTFYSMLIQKILDNCSLQFTTDETYAVRRSITQSEKKLPLVNFCILLPICSNLYLQHNNSCDACRIWANFYPSKYKMELVWQAAQNSLVIELTQVVN